MMILKQEIGPFKSNEMLFNLEKVTYLQLGIERPHSIPLSEIDLSNNEWPIKIIINNDDNKNFILSEKDVLELHFNAQNIKIYTNEINNPYFIINAAYEIAS